MIDMQNPVPEMHRVQSSLPASIVGKHPDDYYTISQNSDQLNQGGDEPVNTHEEVGTTSSWRDLANYLKPIEWSWNRWIPNGMLTILASESGIGKSALALWISSPFLIGADWPDGTAYKGQIGKILWVEAEAAQAINLERAQNWELPIDNILSPLENPLDDIILNNEDHKKAIVDATQQEDVRFVIVDSLRGAAVGDENSSKFIKTVKWLSELARDSGKPILLIHHLRKPSVLDNGKGPNISMLRGSSAIVQPARVIWAIDKPDPSLKEVNRLQVIKSNLGHFPEPLGFKVGNNGLVFCDTPEPFEATTAKEQVSEIILSHLADGPVPSTEMRKIIEEAGLSYRTANREKENLGVTSKKHGNKWYLWIPHEDQYSMFEDDPHN